ncbi:MAG: hypothetical protein AEth_01168 [Candidatus Argoarchaeum ethanivorans]|uniref:Tetratricopeptide repeat protein n=1 Tax=Candidatus Argoarchaeum ethanivorans TaxID=2608793 RepID=A0A8B3S2A5_9EURY|nr:MAG: hypothetical protein AEth_01168 [Candidatus Argoarchaeum ethanivorans]
MKSAKKWYSEGVALAKQGKYEEAITHYDNAIEINPLKFWALRDKADLLFDLKRFEEAVEFFDRALSIEPDAPVTYRHKAEALAKLKRYKEALECYDKSLKVSDENKSKFWALRDKADLLVDLKRFEEALEFFDKALDVNPDAPVTYRHKAEALIWLKRCEEAIEYCDKAIAIDPKYDVAWYYKGYALEELRRYEEAVKCFTKALEIDPKYTRAWRHKGYALEEMKKYEEAIGCYDKAIGVNSKYANVWYRKGILLGKLERYEEAITCYEAVIEIKPKYATAWKNKGVALYKLGKYDEAVACYAKALEINSKNAMTWFNKGIVLNELKKYNKAIDCFDNAIRIDPDYLHAWNNKGYALGKLDRVEEAIECYKKAIAIEPDYKLAKNNLKLAEGWLTKHRELTVTIKNVENSPLPGGTIKVVLYDKDWNLVETASKAYSGGKSLKIKFDNLASGKYFIEVYQKPDAGLKLTEFWGGDEVTVKGSTTKDFVRHTQFVADIKINGESPYGNEIEVNAGDKVHFDVTVKNHEGGTSFNNVQVRFILNRNQSPDYVFDAASEPIETQKNGEAHFGFDFFPLRAGTYDFYIVTSGYYNNKFIVVDQDDWYKAFNAEKTGTPEIRQLSELAFGLEKFAAGITTEQSGNYWKSAADKRFESGKSYLDVSKWAAVETYYLAAVDYLFCRDYASAVRAFGKAGAVWTEMGRWHVENDSSNLYQLIDFGRASAALFLAGKHDNARLIISDAHSELEKHILTESRGDWKKETAERIGVVGDLLDGVKNGRIDKKQFFRCVTHPMIIRSWIEGNPDIGRGGQIAEAHFWDGCELDFDGDWAAGPLLSDARLAEILCNRVSELVEQITRAVTIERAIYDPCKRDFLEGNLPRMRDWIYRHDPGAYWFAMSIENNTDKTIEEWDVDLEMSAALKVREAKIEGVEREIPQEARLKSFKISVPKAHGIVIPKGGAQRVYFKLRTDRLKTTYEISGVFKSAITGDVSIRTKEFKYLCDSGVLPEALKDELEKTFSKEDAARLANTFRVTQGIRNNYCNTDTKTKDISKEFDILKMYLTEKEFLDEVESIQRRINVELRGDERLDVKHVEDVKDFCEKFTEMWIARFLR